MCAADSIHSCAAFFAVVAADGRLGWIPKDDDHGITSEEHLRDEAILVDRLCFLLAFPFLRILSPELLDILQDHVAVPIEGFHSSEELPVVPAIDHDLCVVLD